MKTRLLSPFVALAFILLIIAVFVLIICTTATIYSHSAELYKAGFNKYQISKSTSISVVQLDEAAQNMVDYFSGKIPTPQMTVTIHGNKLPLYSEKELIHLEDVRSIVRLLSTLQIISIILLIVLSVLIYLHNGVGELMRGLQIGAVITVVFTGVLIIWALIDFNSLFLLFHFISFSNDLWILDPTKDHLIMMFPEGFFNDSAILIVSTILIEAVIIWLMAFLIGRWFRISPSSRLPDGSGNGSD